MGNKVCISSKMVIGNEYRYKMGYCVKSVILSRVVDMEEDERVELFNLYLDKSMTSEIDYKNLAEEQDFRYFVRIVPPSEAAEHIAYTTKAVSWDTDVNIGDVTELEIPRTGDLVPCIMFDEFCFYMGVFLLIFSIFCSFKSISMAQI